MIERIIVAAALALIVTGLCWGILALAVLLDKVVPWTLMVGWLVLVFSVLFIVDMVTTREAPTRGPSDEDLE